MLKKKTISFLQSFFTNLFVYTQDTSSVPSVGTADPAVLSKREAKPLEAVILKATRIPALAQGIIHFLSSVLSEVDAHDAMGEFTRWACDVARNALREALEAGDLG